MAAYKTITADATSSKNLTGTGNYTFGHTIGSGSNRVLMFAHLVRNASAPTSITFEGSGLTKAFEGTGNASSIWYLQNPPVGAGTVSVNGTFSDRDLGVSASFFGAEAVDDPIDFTDQQDGSGSPLTASFTVILAGTTVFGGMGGESTAVGSAGSSQTVIATSSEGDSRAGWYKLNYSSGAGTMTWNNLLGANTLVNVGLKPARIRAGNNAYIIG